MWLRYLVISFLNLVMGLLTLVILLAYILPTDSPSLLLQAVGWMIGFAFAFIFSHWAFSKKIPDRKDALMLVVFHIAFFLLIYALYGILISDRGVGVIVSLELVIQLVLEVIAILLAAYHLRRRKLQSMLGEGRMI
ncbi:MAG: hypothetical protein WC787_04885 [Patescibacteria group bacterium]|jgi:hypothetical protein